MRPSSHRPLSAPVVLFLGIVLIGAFIIRLPVLNRDMWEAFCWKSIRYHQVAISMLQTGNPFVGTTCFAVDSFSESLLASWYLVAAYAFFGASVFNLHLAYVCLNLISILVFFLAVRRFIGDALALLGAIMLSITPLAANYSGHAFGDGFLYLGQVMLVWSAAALLGPGFRIRNAVGFMLVCVFLCLAKISTGALLAVMAFFMVNLGLWLRHRERFRSLVLRYPAPFGLLLIFYLGIPALLLAGFVVYTYGHWGQFISQLSRWEYYVFVWRRAVEQMGYPLLFLTAAGLAYYLLTPLRGPAHAASMGIRELVGLTRHPPPPDAPGVSVFESVVLGLFAANVFQTVLQAWAFREHDYYAIAWIVPCVLPGLCFAHRLWSRGHWRLFAILGAIWLAILGFNLPVQAATLRAMYERQYVSQTDREMLRRFFGRRKLTSPRYTVIARDPMWAYHADVNMEFAWTWEILQDEFLRKDRRFIWDHSIDYIIYPRVCTPLPIRAMLNADPVVDLGPDFHKLGLAYRGSDCFIFRIIRGIRRIAPFPGGRFTDPSLPGWTVSGDAFRLTSDGRGPILISSLDGRGNLLSAPFKNEDDVLLYRAGGGLGWDAHPGLPRAPGIRVDLIRDGATAYSQYPVSVDTLQLYAMDLEPSAPSAVYLNVVDSQTDSFIAVGDFQLISYAGYRDNSPCLVRKTAKTLLAEASYATIQWPDHPDWAYIAVNGDRLVMSAHVVGDPGVTELRVPVEEGTHRLSGTVTLDEASQFPIILTLAIRRPEGAETTVLERLFQPGEVWWLDQSFVSEAQKGELSIRCSLEADAKNNYNAKFYFDALMLTSPEGDEKTVEAR